MELRRPYIIGIAGASCSGKSLLAHNLADALDDVVILPLDHYYHDLAPVAMEQRQKRNFDAPGAIEHALFIEQLRQLAAGSPVERPVYDFTTHTRRPETVHVHPARYLIVEGLLTLYWPEARDLMHLKIFVTVPDTICLERRQRRDIVERGRTPESVLTQYRETVAPMYEKFCRPTCRYADLVIDGTQTPHIMTQTVLQYINDHPSQP